MKFHNHDTKVIILLLIIITIFLPIGSFAISRAEKDEFFSQDFSGPILRDSNLKIETVVKGLNFPTQIIFVDDLILVGQKDDGRILIIEDSILQKNTALDLDVDFWVERGLLGLHHVKYNDLDYVFVYFTKSKTEKDSQLDLGIYGEQENYLYRYIWNGTSLISPKKILGPIYFSAPWHQGGVMASEDGILYLGVGDGGIPENILVNMYAKEPDGKGVIYRIDFDGNAIQSNPFTSKFSKFFGMGIRSTYGLAIDPITNNLWETENGPDNYDEINLIFSGFNSGWAKIVGPHNRTSTALSELTNLENSKYGDPKFSWKETIAPTAIEFLNSSKYGANYENDVFVGDVWGNLYHFELNQDRTNFVFSNPLLKDRIADTLEEADSIAFGKNLGLITDVQTGPDGYLYILTLMTDDEPSYPVYTETEFSIKKEGSFTGKLYRILPVDFPSIISSPKKQLEMGILPQNISCKQGFVLLIKFSDNSLACFKESSVKKILERNWGLVAHKRALDNLHDDLKKCIGDIEPYADLSNCDLSYSLKTNPIFIDSDLKGSNLSNTLLERSIFNNTNFNAANLTNSNLQYSFFFNTDFKNSELTYSSFSSSSIEFSDFSNAILMYTDFSNAKFIDVTIQNSNLSNAFFYQAKLQDTNFSYSNLVNSYFGYSNLTNANLQNVDLSNANLQNADLSYVDLRYAVLTNANLAGADLTNANLENAILNCINHIICN